MAVTSAIFGQLASGQNVYKYTLSNSNGVSVDVIELGAIITALYAPDRDGRLADVVLGWDALEPYLDNEPYFGATVGRYANRIGGARVTINGADYDLPANQEPNHLHGGVKGFHKQLWAGEIVAVDGREAVRFSYSSKDGEESYPGRLEINVLYQLSEDNELRIDYSASTNKTTVCNLTNHSYFNLAGEGGGHILDHVVSIDSCRVNKQDETQVHQVETVDIKDTALDFIKPRRIGDGIDAEHELIKIGAGYDQSWILNPHSEPCSEQQPAATLYDPSSGRFMALFTSQPAVQMYSANYLNEQVVGKQGHIYARRSAVCLEAQWYPKSDSEPYNIVTPDKPYEQTICFRFSVKD